LGRAIATGAGFGIGNDLIAQIFDVAPVQRTAPVPTPVGYGSVTGWRWAGGCLLVLGVVMTGLGLLGLRPADRHVREVGGGHRDPMMVICWLVVGSLELLIGAALLLRRRPKGSPGRRWARGAALPKAGALCDGVSQMLTWPPMLMLRSIGRPKYSAGLAALCARVRNSRFCQPGMPGAPVRTIVIRDRK